MSEFGFGDPKSSSPMLTCGENKWPIGLLPLGNPVVRRWEERGEKQCRQGGERMEKRSREKLFSLFLKFQMPRRH